MLTRLQLFLLKIVRRVRKGRVRSRIFLIIAVLITVPAVTGSLLFLRSARSAIRQSVDYERLELARRSASEISLFLSKPKEILEAAAAIISTVYPSPWKQETVLVEMTLEQPIFLNLLSIDTSGSTLAYSELGSTPAPYPAELAAALFEKGDASFISEVSLRDSRIPYVTMAVPIKKVGVTTGALVAQVNLRGVWDIIDRIKLGQTGEAVLLSRDGVILAHPDKKRVLRQEHLAFDRGSRIDGKVLSRAPIEGTDWTIVLQQDTAEAYAFSRYLMHEAWLMIFLGEIIALAGGFYLSRRLARPIESLADKVNRIFGGGPVSVPGFTGRDELRQVSRSLEAIADELQDARARRRFASMGEAAAWISHEMKNCLVAIKSFVQMFPQRHKDARFVESFNRLIPEEIRRWEHMLKELSDFSVTRVPVRTPLDVCRVTGVTLQTMEYELKARDIEVIFTSAQSGVMVEADEERLKQVFLNLVLNAAQSMEAGGRLTVSIECPPEDHAYVYVYVSDTGPGITRENMQRIFEPFVTTGKGRMGLGLTISRRIVEEHGGTLGVRSSPGEGATFFVRLPLSLSGGAMSESTQKGEIGQ